MVSTVLWGRLYCGRICAFGAFTQLMDATIPKRFRVEPPAWLERRAGFVKYGLLARSSLYYIATKHTNVYRYVEPFWMFTLLGRRRAVGDAAVLLVATVSCATCTAASSARSARCSVFCRISPSSDQALVGVQDLQDLREGLRVGRDPGTEDHQVRVRPLRRLRARSTRTRRSARTG